MKSTSTTWQIMEFIYQFADENLRTPNVRDIAEGLGISSTSNVTYHLDKLEADGYIKIERRSANGIRILKPRPGIPMIGRVVPIPLLGYIAAGEPIPTPDPDSGLEISDANFFFVDRSQLPRGELGGIYALRVKGKSMIDALIDDGDIVIIRYQQSADIGETVVARLKDENTTTLKSYHPKGNKVELRPANPNFKPIKKKLAQVEIQGKVLLVIRKPLHA